MPPASFSAPAARSHSGWLSTSQPAPCQPPASSSAVEQKMTSRRRPGDRVSGRVAAGGAGGAGEAAHDLDLHRDHGLHVQRAAAPDVAVGQVAAERVVGPAVRLGRHDVEVRKEQQRVAATAVAADAGHDRAAAGERLDDRRREPSARARLSR